MNQDLSSKAMLVKLSISTWTASKHDKKISKEIADKHGAKSDAGRYNKVLVAKKALNTINSINNEIRSFHYENTLPWSDEGLRILPSANFMEYTKKMRELKAKREAAIRDFVEEYPQYVEEAKERLGDMFSETDYPHPQEIEHKFAVRTGTYPMPAAEDFRVRLRKSDTQQVRKEIEESVKEATSIAIRDLWQRLHDGLSRISERLNDPEKIFRDSLITNLTELCALLPKLNITDDPDLEEMRKRVEEKICTHYPDDLREDKEERKEVAQEADDILATMSGYIGGGEN
ncbi:MAG: hypothetical protein WDA09_02305 [Bacteriovoracaceae bacterium]